MAMHIEVFCAIQICAFWYRLGPSVPWAPLGTGLTVSGGGGCALGVLCIFCVGAYICSV